MEVEEWTKYIFSQKDKFPESLQTTIEEATGKIDTIAVAAGSLLIKFIQNVFQGVFLLVLVPFFLVYMLKDHEKFAPFVAKFFKGRKENMGTKNIIRY